MAKGKSDAKREAEDLMSAIMSYVSGAIKRQGRDSTGGNSNKQPVESGSSSNKIIAGFIQKLMTMLAPAAILATILSSAASGMSVFFGAIKILGNTMGSVLLPVVMLGGAAILTLSDVINAQLLPNLEAWYTFLLTEGVSWIENLDTGIATFLDNLDGYIASLDSSINSFLQVIRTVLKVTSGMLSMLPGGKGISFAAMTTLNSVKSQFSGSGGISASGISGKIKELLDKTIGKGNGIGGLSGPFRDNLKLMIAQMRHDNAPASREMGIAEAARNAQMAAFQMSPFEQKTSDQMTKIIDALERANEKLTPGATK